MTNKGLGFIVLFITKRQIRHLEVSAFFTFLFIFIAIFSWKVLKR